ncbi:hypothetical protein GCM10011581_49140 [Saccharopolyspora subtropica]|uniref:Uncharacterized protein n=2 Tax=Saccharopolyspora thermophila TaxID=89367 RepID=A0A917KAX5_9PSEU|nr:hypothetical protein GCM10011581_49140 [Saccharopolyspora subtropica]
MCARWHIPATDQRDELVVTMLLCDEVSITQGDNHVIVAKKQLTKLADKLYFLDQAFRVDARDVVEALCCSD